jgi:hypothetical protein
VLHYLEGSPRLLQPRRGEPGTTLIAAAVSQAAWFNSRWVLSGL